MTTQTPPPLHGLLLVLTLSVAAPASGQAPSHPRQNQYEQNPEASPDEKKSEHHIYWDDGLHIWGWFDLFKMKIGGQAQNDTAIFLKRGEIETELGQLENGVEWRRARLYASGLITDIIEFNMIWQQWPVSGAWVIGLLVGSMSS